MYQSLNPYVFIAAAYGCVVAALLAYAWFNFYQRRRLQAFLVYQKPREEGEGVAPPSA